jgi:acyl-CoA oxidase
MDNGLAYFDNVEIPRRNMAMRFAVVDENGKYSKKHVSDAASKVAYITMMQVRTMIVMGSSKALAMSTAVTIRYSAVRKQGYKEDGKTEVQVLDYKQQQHRIFPLLAASYCFFFSGRKLGYNLKQIEDKLINKKAVTKQQVADIHATSSALKSFNTMIAADGIEECRKACGGHGFLSSSGLPELMCSYLQSPTVEVCTGK